MGVQFTNGRDELISAGGRTVKNVAGYDLTKFIVGSAGVFGTIVTLTTRTYKKPQAALIARYVADIGILNRLMTTALRPQWAMLTFDSLLCGYLGDNRTIDYDRSALPKSEPLEIRERSVEQESIERSNLWRDRGRITCRASVPPNRIGEFTKGLPDRAWVADAAFGILLVSNLRPERIEALQAHARRAEVCFRFISTDENGSHPLIDFSTNPVERQIIDRLKQAFDPDGKLTPLPWQTS